MDQPTSRASRIRRLSGALLLGLGALLLTASGGYYAYSVIAKSRMEALTYTVERPSPPVPFSPAVPASGETRADAVLNASALQVAGAATLAEGEAALRQGRSPGASAPTAKVSATDRIGADLAKVSGSETASTVPVGELQSEADAVAGRQIALEVNGRADTPPSPQVSVVAQAAPAVGAGEGVVGVTSPVAAPLASVETARSVPTAGIQIEDARTKLPEATEDVSLAKDVSGGEARGSVGSDNAEINLASGQAPASEAGLTAVLSPMETNGEGLLDDDKEMVAYIESGLGKTGLSSSERAALNAEVAKYSLPSPSDLNGTRLTATRIWIPVIDVDSDVDELAVVLRDNVRSWDTPKWVVGHIPTTALPADQGQGLVLRPSGEPHQGRGQCLPEAPGDPRAAGRWGSDLRLSRDGGPQVPLPGVQD